MNTQFEEKRATVKTLLQQKDFHLGFRKMLDCVLDTESKEAYQRTISLNECMETSNWSVDEKSVACLELLASLPMPESKTITDQPMIETTDVNKTYGRHKFRLGDVNMKIWPGEIWGLVGENGNGKTTLLRILAKDLTFDSGEIKYSIVPEQGADYDLRTKLVYLPQRTAKWYGSLKANLKFAATSYGIVGEENELMVMMYIIRFGLWPFRNHQWSELSSGYKMRFELARTFLRKPNLLFLDEPLANLDVLAQQLILEDLHSLTQSLAQPLGIVLSSQQLFEVEKVSNHVIFLKQGKPTHLSDAIAESNKNHTILELDAKIDRSALTRLLFDCTVVQINYNGGVFLIELADADGIEKVLGKLLNNKIKITYFRDITHSTRRLFN